MTAPSAWRPLSEAPKGTVAVVVKSDVYGEVVAYYEPQEGYWFHWYGGLAHEFTGYELFAPIADTLELDRAVQKAVAEAFGELLGFARFPARASHCIDRARNILHTSMGGRIPDEVP